MVSVGQFSRGPRFDVYDKEAGEGQEDFSSKYTFKSEIGRGRFAKVNRVVNRNSNESFAAKVIRRWRNGKDTLQNVMREIRIAQICCSCDRVAQIRDYHIGEREVILIFEHAVGGDLYHLVNDSDLNLPVDFVQSAVFQLLRAVSFLHSHSVVHLDVKPENILLRRPLPDCDVVLCDFGLAKFLDNGCLVRDLVGTPDYAAPEILDYNPIHLNTDIWSVGAVTYYLLTGVSPFWAPTKEQTFENVCLQRISYPEDLFGEVPREAVEFIRKLLVKNPRLRPSAADCLNDPWFQSKNIQSVPPVDSQEAVSIEITDTAVNNDHCSEQSRIDLDRSIGEC
ncbi:Serine/threonine kinase [Fasciola hepatica]|uniref:Serine/threonine kinase n=1 Tax=Fasciola hepatica TaxID=6192 RepID=A0A4E0RZ56_FASHE|nr:Serine/threonine kinase [Fasciola hepatica]